MTCIPSIFKYSLDSILPNPHGGKSRNMWSFERIYNKLSQFWTEFASILLTQLYFLLLHLRTLHFFDAAINKCLCYILFDLTLLPVVDPEMHTFKQNMNFYLCRNTSLSKSNFLFTYIWNDLLNTFAKNYCDVFDLPWVRLPWEQVVSFNHKMMNIIRRLIMLTQKNSNISYHEVRNSNRYFDLHFRLSKNDKNNHMVHATQSVTPRILVESYAHTNKVSVANWCM